MILRPPGMALPARFATQAPFLPPAARRASRFDATSERLRWTAGLPSSTVLTATMWLRMAVDRNTFSTPWSVSSSTGNYFYFETDSDGVTLKVWHGNNGATAGSTTGVALTVGKWYFVAATLNGGAFAQYTQAEDALALTAQTASVSNNAAAWTTMDAGDNSAFTGEEWNGNVAHLKLWSGVVLTQPEIERERYSYWPVKQEGLHLWCPLDRNQDWRDFSGNNRHPTPNGTLTLEQGAPATIILPEVVRYRRRAAFAAAGGAQTIAIGQVTETDTAQLVARTKRRALGQPSETDTAQPIARLKRRTIGQPAETDSAQPIARLKLRAVAQAAETDSAQPVTRAKRRALGQPAETDTAQAVARAKRRAVAQASETDLAQPVTFAGAKTIAVGQAAETDAAQPIARAKRRAIAQASETDLAQPIARAKRRAVGQAAEADTAQPIARAKRRALGQATEADLAQPVSPPGVKLVAVLQAAETDSAQPIVRAKRRALGQVLEADSAQPIAAGRARQLGLVLEIDLAQPVAWAPKRRVVGQAVEVDSALAIAALLASLTVPAPAGPGYPPRIETGARPAQAPARRFGTGNTARPRQSNTRRY